VERRSPPPRFDDVIVIIPIELMMALLLNLLGV
jgi:hypothetical protein